MLRRHFLQAVGGSGLLSGQLRSQPRPRRYDILIKNGEVRDPSRSFRQRADVAVAAGKIAAIEESISAEAALDVIDARG
jgi:adenine deaminase